MRSEISAAANWWTTKLHDAAPHFSAEKVELFNVSLKIALFHRFGAHWYEEEPLKGQAYRSLMASRNFVDSIILGAAEKAKIGCVGDLLHKICGDVTMWVDPRMVEVRLEGTSGKSHTAVIYKGYVAPVQPLQTRRPSRPSTLFVPSQEQQIQQLRMHGRLSENYMEAEMQLGQPLEQCEYYSHSAYATPADPHHHQHRATVDQQENFLPANRQLMQGHYQPKYAPSSQPRMTGAAPVYQPRTRSYQPASCASEYLQRQEMRSFHVNRSMPAYRSS